MSAVLELPEVKKKCFVEIDELPCEKVILHDVSWETYQKLVQDQMGKREIRLSYDDGDLQIMVESIKHAKLAAALGEIVSAIGDILELDFIGAGSTTFRKEKGRKGFEPDDSYYFENAPLMRRKNEIDLAVDPPPELIVEVDVTSPSLPRFPIFAEVGVAEVWRYDGTEVKFYRLQKNRQYAEVEKSECLPNIRSETVTELLEAGFEMSRLEWRRLIKQKVEENK
jgi:Uma2 family endonuclease